MESSDPVDTPMMEKSKLDEDPLGKLLTLHTIVEWLAPLCILQPVDQTLHLLYACVPARNVKLRLRPLELLAYEAEE
ncbi:hypothetical protein Tco_1426748 [Tanacetum coccineum]